MLWRMIDTLKYKLAAPATAVFFLSVLLVIAVVSAANCTSGSPSKSVITTSEATTATAARHQRRTIDFYKGIAEPRADAWQQMVHEAGRLQKDGFNAVTLSPPVDINARAGGQLRIILEGEAASADILTGAFHEANLAVHIAPTTRVPGLNEQIEANDANLDHLNDDTLKWADKAETNQAELFSPLSRYNLVLGTEAAQKWSDRILPQVRQRFHGPVAAKVAADLGDPPAAGAPHDFEKLNYRGYDFLMLDIFPKGANYNAGQFEAYLNDVLARAAAVSQRDGLKGIMIGEFGAWREQSGSDPVDGPILGEDAQAVLASRVLEIAIPQTRGVFYFGWTLPGRGARGYPVENALRKAFNPGAAMDQ